MWRRFVRSKGFILLLFAAIFSFGILGQVDTRMHIGGSDWDLDSLIYINVDEYILDDLAYQDYQGQPLISNETPGETASEAPSETEESLDGVTGVVSLALADGPVEVAEEVVVEEAKPDSPAPSRADSQLQVATPPVAAPPQVEERKEEKPSIFTHRVRSGETLWDIASAYGTTVDSILSANDLRNPNMLTIGQELNILSVKGVLHQVATGESLWEISERYEVAMDEITKANNISDPSRLQPNMKLVIPGATMLRPRDVLVVNGQLQRAFDWPLRGRISSPFGPRWGRMHNGLDIAVPTGTHVRATADGRVSFAGWNGGYGILVIIDHGNGVETRYAHLSRLNVKVGQKVDRGQVVAFSGNTGVSTGPHLHYEIRYRNNPVNPQTYLK